MRNEIREKRFLNQNTVYMKLDCPRVAAKAHPGQFVIVRADEKGERVPLTIADYDREQGTVSIIFQMLGVSTQKLGALEAGAHIPDMAGPLGRPSELDGYAGKKVAVIGGGLGCAIAYPQAKHLHSVGTQVDIIAGFRTESLIILADEMKAVSSACHIYTDDGSNQNRGFVTDGLEKCIQENIKNDVQYNLVIAIGPTVMMKFVSLLTKKYNIKTVVSLNPIMIDGTGMCGCCRVTVGGKMKFACVDGPDFDGHEVDYDRLIARLKIYEREEKAAMESHACRLTGDLRGVQK